jgi:hypothetical protein
MVRPGQKRMAALDRTRGCQHRLGGRRGEQDPRKAPGGGFIAVSLPDAATVNVVPATEGNGNG